MTTHRNGKLCVAGEWAHRGKGPSNAPSAPFWMQLALIGLRYIKKHIERAEEREPDCTGRANFHVERAIRELEARFLGKPSGIAPEGKGKARIEPASASTQSALGLDL